MRRWLAFSRLIFSLISFLSGFIPFGSFMMRIIWSTTLMSIGSWSLLLISIRPLLTVSLLVVFSFGLGLHLILRRLPIREGLLMLKVRVRRVGVWRVVEVIGWWLLAVGMTHGVLFVGRIVGWVVRRVVVAIGVGRVVWPLWLSRWIALLPLLIRLIVVIWGFSVIVVAHIIN